MDSRSQQTTNLPHGYVRLDVGGISYTTSISTLTRYPNSMLYSMFTQENIPLAQDKEGRYIIDRDGTVFRYILNFLRGGNLNLPSNFSDFDQLIEEVDFYQLDEMKELLHFWKIVKSVGVDSKWMSPYRQTQSTVTLKVGDKDFHFPSESMSRTTEEKLQCMANQPLIEVIFDHTGDEFLGTARTYRREIKTKLRNGTVDCDSTCFQYILNFLMGRGAYMPKNQTELENLKKAVDHFSIDDMKILFDNKICDASNSYLMFQA